MAKHTLNFLILFIPISLFTLPCYSHHPLMGENMVTFNHGILSGIGHPILGFDHLIFIIGLGILSILVGKTLIGSLAFIIGTFLGIFLITFGLNFPLTELMVCFSLIFIGAYIFSDKTFNNTFFISLLSFLGLFHGLAFGDPLITNDGLNASVVYGYLIGLFFTIGAISLFAGRLFVFFTKKIDLNSEVVKISGGVVAGSGTILVLENLEGMLFAAIF